MNEDDIVCMFRQKLGCGKPPDDIERVMICKAAVAAKIDTLVFETDVPPGMTMYEAARKAVVACVSDFAAKGIRPKWGVISVTMPSDTGMADFEDLAAGMADAASEFGFKIVGGDTNRGSGASLSVCLLGTDTDTVGRGGSAPGDCIMVSGPFGLAAAGLQIMLHHTGNFPAAVESVRNPTARLEFGVLCAPHFTSSMDSSDGLATTLYQMAQQSDVRMRLTDSPAAAGLYDFAIETGTDYDDLIYHGGEEYEIVFTALPSDLPLIRHIAAQTDTPAVCIGVVESGRGVYVGDTDCPLRRGGWKAF